MHLKANPAVKKKQTHNRCACHHLNSSVVTFFELEKQEYQKYQNNNLLTWLVSSEASL